VILDYEIKETAVDKWDLPQTAVLKERGGTQNKRSITGSCNFCLIQYFAGSGGLQFLRYSELLVIFISVFRW
jgi:hypothetical protein